MGMVPDQQPYLLLQPNRHNFCLRHPENCPEAQQMTCPYFCPCLFHEQDHQYEKLAVV